MTRLSFLALSILVAFSGFGPTPAGGQQPAAEKPATAAPSAAALAVSMETVLSDAIRRAAPSVVAISRVAKADSDAAAVDFSFNVPTLEQPALDPTAPQYVPAHFASGVILSADGLILTCYHALDDPRQHDYHVWWRGQHAEAEVVRTAATVLAGDPWTDLAVLKIEAQGLPAMPLGEASSLRQGSLVISLGNPYAIARDGRASASWGIVSNLQRAARPTGPSSPDDAAGGGAAARQSLAEFGTLIQTDARLNLGTSGGALVDLQGRMVGLTTSLAAVAGYEQAAGYAIALDAPTRQTIQRLREGRQPAFGFLGVEPRDNPGGRGARLSRVVPGLAADKAGLVAGDVILAVDRVPTDGAIELFRELSRRPADSQVELLVSRSGPQIQEGQRQIQGGQPQTVRVRLGKKQLHLAKPGFSQVAEPTWRGARIDWASALPPSQLMFSQRPMQADLAILRVDPDTAAWRAGLRPGQFVRRFDGQPVSRPDAFYRLAGEAQGDVPIQIVGSDGRPRRVIVAAQ
ncbi:trypsin-like peptidase domain-containing protein [Roseimaritima sediminicola]|uniref:trypsin-like peptidase domain-containing protein n=1 Tax=Roseimaritima sediminicola TaxID=2662066 RepID=UPI00129823CE|nr:trypsin-like peptidase domain-containing protein [Roseimaritima sediminicola]